MKWTMALCLAILSLLVLDGPAPAKVVGQTVEYRQNGTLLKGYLAYDDAVKGRRPGVLVVHEFWGLNDFARQRADKLAEMGYTALAVDMYGEGKVTRDRAEATKLAGHVRSTPLMRERAQAGLKVLRKHNLVDPQRLAAIGFCFGGTTVLELAYSGADVKGVVSFHGGLTAPKPEDRKRLKAKILILHGAEDPHVKAEEIKAFQEAMRQAGADWQMIYYGGAVHSFANPEAGRDKSSGVAYDPKAAARSWQHMQLSLQEIFQNKMGLDG
ncbi:MAG: dienelactone hydrolase family protein [Deltaproteobacteria bacterium]|nr:dienelactone hydrolase family protein [Deltaproteobacteria bacterium]